MNTYPLEIVTPDGQIFDGEVERLIVRAINGDVCILKNHSNYVVPLGIGKARVKSPDGNYRDASCNSGTLIVSGGSAKLIAMTFEWADEIDTNRAEKAKLRAEEKIKNHKSDYELQLAELKLKRALNRLNVANRK